jgi:hypothetical protein
MEEADTQLGTDDAGVSVDEGLALVGIDSYAANLVEKSLRSIAIMQPSNQ